VAFYALNSTSPGETFGAAVPAGEAVDRMFCPVGMIAVGYYGAIEAIDKDIMIEMQLTNSQQHPVVRIVSFGLVCGKSPLGL
jgi:hypothetical protein